MHVIPSLKLQYFVWLKNKALYPWYSFFIVTNWATTVLSSTRCYLCTGRQRSLHWNMTHVFLVALINMKRRLMMTHCNVGSRFKGALMIREKKAFGAHPLETLVPNDYGGPACVTVDGKTIRLQICILYFIFIFPLQF